MHFVLLNANTTEALTERMVSAARKLVPPGTTIEGITAPFGEPYISTPQARATAERAVIEVADHLRKRPVQPDAVILACFGDPGLWQARQLLSCPVIGMADASCLTACQLGRRFSIITGGRAWGPMLEAFVTEMGLASRLASVRTIERTGAEIAADPQSGLAWIAAEVAAAVGEDKADVVILGGAGLIGLARQLPPIPKIVVLDSLDIAVAQAIALSGVGRL